MILKQIVSLHCLNPFNEILKKKNKEGEELVSKIIGKLQILLSYIVTTDTEAMNRWITQRKEVRKARKEGKERKKKVAFQISRRNLDYSINSVVTTE